MRFPACLALFNSRHTVLAAVLLAPGLAFAEVATGIPDLDCVIEPNMVVELSSRVEGVLESVTVDKGTVVHEGDVLATLESGEEQATLAYAEARAERSAELMLNQVSLAYGQRNKNRIASLYDRNAVSADDIDKAETDAKLVRLKLEQAREERRLALLDVKRAEEKLEQFTLRSPIDGLVTQRYLNPGESVKDRPITQIAQIDPLRVEIIVPVTHFGALVKNQRVNVSPEVPLSGSFPATVSIIDPVIDAASGTFRVRLNLPNPERKLTSGLKCRAHFLDDIAPEPAPVQQPQRAPTTGSPGKMTQAPGQPPLAASSEEETSEPETPADPLPTSGTAIASAEPTMLCRSIGPITGAEMLEQISSALHAFGTVVPGHEEATGAASRYFLVSEKESNESQLRELAERIRNETGIRDIEPVFRGRFSNRVSMGIYTNVEYAEERLSVLRQHGFEAELVPSGRSARKWLEVQMADANRTDSDIHNAIDAIHPGLTVKQTACNHPIDSAKTAQN